MRKSYKTVLNDKVKLEKRINELNNNLEALRRQQIIFPQPTAMSNHVSNRLYQFKHEKDILISEQPGCRAMIYSAQNERLFTSCRSIFELGFSISSVDIFTGKSKRMSFVSSKIIRDMTIIDSKCSVCFVTMESSLKIFDYRSTIFTTKHLNLEGNLWSCNASNDSPNNLYVGAHNGKAYEIDLRAPLFTLHEYTTESDSSPIVNVVTYPHTVLFPYGGVLMCKLTSIWFLLFTNSNHKYTAYRLNIQGPFVNMSLDYVTLNILVQTRNISATTLSKFHIGTLEMNVDEPYFSIKNAFNGSSCSKYMTRSCFINVPENLLVAGYLNNENKVAIYDRNRNQRVQSLDAYHTVYDTLPIYKESDVYLAGLTDTKCLIYKMYAH